MSKMKSRWGSWLPLEEQSIANTSGPKTLARLGHFRGAKLRGANRALFLEGKGSLKLASARDLKRHLASKSQSKPIE